MPSVDADTGAPSSIQRRYEVSGVLKKRGSVLGAWVERFYELRFEEDTYNLKYKIKQEDPEYRNSVTLKNFRLEIDSSQDPLMFTIEILSPNSQVIVLRAENIHDFSVWTNKLLSLSQSQRSSNEAGSQSSCIVCKKQVSSPEDLFCCSQCLNNVCSSEKCVDLEHVTEHPICSNCKVKPDQNVFVLMVESARGLAAFDMNGLSDPYVAFEYNDASYTTSVQHKTLNPEWNKRFVLPLSGVDAPRALTLRVFDHDTFGSHSCMGYVRISIAYLENLRVYESDFQLRKPKSEKNKVKGTIRLKFMKQSSQKLPLAEPTRDFHDAAMALRASEVVSWIKDIFTFSNPLSSVWWFAAYCMLCLKLPVNLVPLMFPTLYLIIALSRLLENLCEELASHKQAALRKDAILVRSSQESWVAQSDKRTSEMRNSSGLIPDSVLSKQSPALAEAHKAFGDDSSPFSNHKHNRFGIPQSESESSLDMLRTLPNSKLDDIFEEQKLPNRVMTPLEQKYAEAPPEFSAKEEETYPTRSVDDVFKNDDKKRDIFRKSKKGKKNSDSEADEENVELGQSESEEEDKYGDGSLNTNESQDDAGADNSESVGDGSSAKLDSSSNAANLQSEPPAKSKETKKKFWSFFSKGDGEDKQKEDVTLQVKSNMAKPQQLAYSQSERFESTNIESNTAPAAASQTIRRKKRRTPDSLDEQRLGGERLRKLRNRSKLVRYKYTYVQDLAREITSMTEVMNWLCDVFFQKPPLAGQDNDFARDRSVYMRTIQFCAACIVILLVVPLRLVLVAFGAYHFTAQLRRQPYSIAFKSKTRLQQAELSQRLGAPSES